MPIVFAAFSPHPPIILPTVGSEEDRSRTINTIKALENLGEKFAESKPDDLIISSPHPDWGFNVPLFFFTHRSLALPSETLREGRGEGGLAKNFKGKTTQILVEGLTPQEYFEQGKDFAKNLEENKKYAFIASGDMSHCLKKDGPYGFRPDGPKFDKTFIEALKKKDIETILRLNETYPEAAECGLRSFCFLLGVLEGAKISWTPEILSYEGPFGVGYLVSGFDLN